MRLNPTQFVIRWVTPTVWRLYPGRARAAFHEFAQIEKDSGRQLLRCMSLVSDPATRAQLFDQVLEEYFHADLFEGLCTRTPGDFVRGEPRQAEPLISEEGSPLELRRFLAFVYAGESQVNRDFQLYSRSLSDKKAKAVFHRVWSDEDRHEAGTRGILSGLCEGNRIRVTQLLLGARVRHIYRQYSGFGRKLGALPLSIALSVLYFFFGALVGGQMKQRLLMSRAEQLALFKGTQ